MLVSEQLALPLPDVDATQRGRIPRLHQVFTNRSVKMPNIAWIGFDVDHVLAVYHRNALERACSTLCLERLRSMGIATSLSDRDVDITFPISGLVIDRQRGHVVKLDQHLVARRAYHGIRPLTEEQLRSEYGERSVLPGTWRFRVLDAPTRMTEVSLFSALVHEADQKDTACDFATLHDRVRSSCRDVYCDGTLRRLIRSNMPQYISVDPLLPSMLSKLRSAGKRLFILTNSHPMQVDAIMTHVIGSPTHNFPTWRDYFDLVLCSADKPDFFLGEEPFLERDGASLQAVSIHSDVPLFGTKTLEGGNLADFEHWVGASGNQILYISGFVEGKTLRLVHGTPWRTVLILPDLKAELTAIEAASDDVRRHAELSEQRCHIDEERRAHESIIKELARTAEPTRTTKKRSRSSGPSSSPPLDGRIAVQLRLRRREIDTELHDLETSIGKHIHPHWGWMLKEGVDLSSFGDQVQNSACLYTSNVTNFSHYTTTHHFRSDRDTMPHER